MPDHRGFSLIETILMIALTGLLAALLLPVIAGTRDSAARIVRLSNLRQSANVLQDYSRVYDDLWPHYTLPPPENLVVRFDGQIRVVPYFHGYAQWHVILADEFLDGNWKSEVYAPAGETFLERGSHSGFHVSASLRARPEFWNPSTRTGPSQWRPTRVSETVFPSAKSIMVDRDSNTSRTSKRLLPLAFADGSASSFVEQDVPRGYVNGEGDYEGAWFHAGMRGMHTIDGVRGRDVLR